MERLGRRARRWVPVVWRRRLAVFVGGVMGTAGRYGVEAVLAADTRWPWGTLAVNLTGALLLGFVSSRLLRTGRTGLLTVTFVGIGILGSYTTFGAFVEETWQLGADGVWAAAIAYPSLSIGGGLAAVIAGARLAEGRR